MGAKIQGVGACLPALVVGRAELVTEKSRYGCMPEEFFEIPNERRHCSEAETASALGAKACLQALKNAQVSPESVDLLLCFSAMHDRMFPKDGQRIALEAGLVNATALDVDTACASFVSMLKLGTSLIESGMHKHILIVATSNWVNRAFDNSQDFSPIGDGAGALLLSETKEESSLLGVKELRNGKYFDFVSMKSPYVTEKIEYLEFKISDEFKGYANRDSLQIAKDLMIENRCFPKDISWFVPHQPAQRAMNFWCENLEIPQEKLLSTFQSTGNLMAANMPVILDRFINKESRIQRGDVILFFALASGFHGVAMLWKY
jgi:3-oxoacyl-[acyl-carrier-protein] synthase-3